MVSTIADIVFVCIGVAVVVNGVRRGFLATVIHLLKYILAFVLAYCFGGAVAGLLGEHIFSSPVKSMVYDCFFESYSKSPAAFDAAQAIESLPSFLLSDSVREGIESAQGCGEVLLQNMTDAVSAPIISVISNIFGYILAFLLSLAGLWLVAKILTKLTDKLNLFGRLNRLLGFALGLLMAIIVLFAVSSVVRFFWGTTDFYQGTVVLKFFGESSILRFLSFLDLGRIWWTG